MRRRKWNKKTNGETKINKCQTGEKKISFEKPEEKVYIKIMNKSADIDIAVHKHFTRFVRNVLTLAFSNHRVLATNSGLLSRTTIFICLYCKLPSR